MRFWPWTLLLVLLHLPTSNALITSAAVRAGVASSRSEVVRDVASSVIKTVRGRTPHITRRPKLSGLAGPLPRDMDRVPKIQKERKQLSDQIQNFFTSARSVAWATFLTFWVFLAVASYLLYARQDLKFWWQHIFSMAFWIFMGVVYLGIVDAQADADAVDDWLDGYIVELILSMENIFLYEMILVSFRVPPKLSRKILYITSFCQMFFQMWLFMFVASYLQDIHSLPYLLGAWLMYMGVTSLREDDHGSFEPENSDLFKALSSALGSRLLPYYSSDGRMIVTKDGKLCMTMLLPVTVSIIMVMFIMEVDVTLAKIETIPSNFIGWTSSVLVAFALSDLYVIVSELFRAFYLMRTGVSALLLFFGGLLLVREEVQISDGVEIGVMLAIVIGSIVLSVILDMGPKHGAAYDESEEEQDEDLTPDAKAEKYSNAEATLFALY